MDGRTQYCQGISTSQLDLHILGLSYIGIQCMTHVIRCLSKSIENATPRVNPRVNYGAWVIIMF